MMKIPEFPELTHRQADTIITIIFVIGFFILVPIFMISQHLAEHQFYVSHKQECIAQKGTWNEKKDRNGDFTWSCKY